MRGKRIEERLERIEQLLKEEEGWKSLVNVLMRERKELLDRLMARNFEELKVFERLEGEGEKRAGRAYEPESDLANAGTAVAVRS